MDAATAWLIAASAALLLLRALAAALEAALVAVGLPRARALAAEAGAGRRARALRALLEGREDAEASRAALESLAAMGAAVIAALAAWRALPGWTGGLAAGLAVVACAFLSLALSGAGREAGARRPEPVGLALALPARGLALLLAPAVRLAAALPRALGRSPGRFAPPPPPLEELERALAERAGAAGGRAGQAASEMIHRVFAFGEKVARDVMVPRTEVLAVDLATPVPELLTLLAERGHSRLPVYRESLENVVGILHVRDLVPLLEHPGLIVLADLVRPACFVPWSRPIDGLLRELQRRHLHMAVVVDEFGGVMGLCTIEDLLEEIVGELGDEFEAAEAHPVEAHADGSFGLRGDAPVAEFNRASGAGLPEDRGYETVGGFLNALAGAIPAAGDRFAWRGWIFTVGEATPRLVVRVRAARVKRQQP